MQKLKKILIVGGGFAGVKAALELAGDPRVSVTLVSDRPIFRYYPALYHSATGGSSMESTIPLEQIFAGKPVTIVQAMATKLDRKNRLIITQDAQKLSFDILILALGSQTNYFGIKGLAEFSYGIKSLEDAEQLKHHLHQQLIDKKAPDLNYVIVGGGPTGVELAGALSAYLRDMCRHHGIGQPTISIDLVEAAPHVLPRMPLSFSKHVERRLQKLGVTLYLNQKVQAETANDLVVNGKTIKTQTVIWTAGVANNDFFAANSFKLSAHGKVVVDQYLQAEPDIYVLGDNADTPYAGMAQTALNDAVFMGRHIMHVIDDEPAKPYKPKQPTYVIPVGPYWAAVLWGKVQILGGFGWLLRRAADLLGYHDILPLLSTLGVWFADFRHEDDCPVCK